MQFKPIHGNSQLYRDLNDSRSQYFRNLQVDWFAALADKMSDIIYDIKRSGLRVRPPTQPAESACRTRRTRPRSAGPIYSGPSKINRHLQPVTQGKFICGNVNNAFSIYFTSTGFEKKVITKKLYRFNVPLRTGRVKGAMYFSMIHLLQWPDKLYIHL